MVFLPLLGAWRRAIEVEQAAAPGYLDEHHKDLLEVMAQIDVMGVFTPPSRAPMLNNALLRQLARALAYGLDTQHALLLDARRRWDEGAVARFSDDVQQYCDAIDYCCKCPRMSSIILLDIRLREVTRRCFGCATALCTMLYALC